MKSTLNHTEIPSEIHRTKAKEEYEKETGLQFEDLPTRKKNSLAKEQMYHQAYSDLCDAIMGR